VKVCFAYMVVSCKRKNDRANKNRTTEKENVYLCTIKRMTRQISILLIVMLGFFLTPTLTYACGTSAKKTEKSCCEKGASKADKKDCCKQDHSQKDKNDDGCGGQCGNSSCHCPTLNIAIALPFVSELKHNVFIAQKRSIPYTETYFSSGFLSIWLPPKIS
jgi:hypothetical protein